MSGHVRSERPVTFVRNQRSHWSGKRTWLRKQRLDTAAPAEFATILEVVVSFAEPLIGNDPAAITWNPFEQAWSGTG